MSSQNTQGGIHLDLQKSFGSLAECVVVTRPDRRILFVNDAVEEVFGYTKQELIGGTPEHLYANPEGFAATGDLAYGHETREKGQRFTLRLKRKNGETFSAEIVASAIYDGTSSHVGHLFIARDISDQITLESLVGEAARTLEDALEAISEGFALYDRDDRLVICNDMYRQIYAHSAAEMVPGKTFTEILQYGLVQGEYDLQGKTPAQWLEERLARHRRADGVALEQVLADGRWFNIAERKTRSGGIAGIRTDITQLKQAEKRLSAACADLSLLSDSLPASIVEVDLDGLCIFANKTATLWFDCPVEELVGSRIRDRLGQEAPASRDTFWERARAGARTVLETDLVYPDGRHRFVRLEYVPKIDEHGRVKSLIAAATDISELKHVETQLKEAYQNMTILADSLSCAISEIDRNGNCTFINKIGAQWLGGTPENLIGTPIRKRLPKLIQIEKDKHIQKGFAGEMVQVEMEFTYPDGIHRIVEIEYTPKFDARGNVTGLIALSTDTTDRKRTERTLAELYSITSTRELSNDEKINLILKLGCEHFDLPFGIISHIIDDHYTIVRGESPNGEIKVGDAFELGRTYCVLTLQSNRPVAISEMKSSDYAQHPCYQDFGLETYIGTPILVDGERYGTINFTSAEARRRSFTQTDSELIRQFADWVGHEIARQQDQEALMEAYIRLERISSIDDLTGILNRRAFLERAATEVARFRRTKRKFTTVLIDIDHFKSINDTYGHAAGDAVLKRFSDLVSDTLRAVDVFGRVGGEEFCIILDNTIREDAIMVADRIRQRIQNECRLDSMDREVTCSMGLSAVRDGDVEFSSLLQRVDGAIYKAKEAGRNRCFTYSEVADQLAPID